MCTLVSNRGWLATFCLGFIFYNVFLSRVIFQGLCYTLDQVTGLSAEPMKDRFVSLPPYLIHVCWTSHVSCRHHSPSDACLKVIFLSLSFPLPSSLSLYHPLSSEFENSNQSVFPTTNCITSLCQFPSSELKVCMVVLNVFEFNGMSGR